MQDKIKLYKEIDEHLLKDEKPSKFLNDIRDDYKFKEIYPFLMLAQLIQTEQNLTHHPEGSVWNHTLMVIDEAAKRKSNSDEPRVFMWTALLHDLGKAPTTRIRKGKITSYDHDKVGKELSIKFLKEFNEEEEFIRKVSSMVRWHMQTLFVVKDLPFADIRNMLLEVPLKEIALFSLCDRLGRGRMTREKENEERKNIEVFKEKCTEFMWKEKTSAKKEGVKV
jgi:tRNA nucleotidyltransferase (CCA-adding enzyme)